MHAVGSALLNRCLKRAICAHASSSLQVCNLCQQRCEAKKSDAQCALHTQFTTYYINWGSITLQQTAPAHVQVNTDDHHEVIMISASSACWRDFECLFLQPLE